MYFHRAIGVQAFIYRHGDRFSHYLCVLNTIINAFTCLCFVQLNVLLVKS